MFALLWVVLIKVLGGVVGLATVGSSVVVLRVLVSEAVVGPGQVSSFNGARVQLQERRIVLGRVQSTILAVFVICRFNRADIERLAS